MSITTLAQQSLLPKRHFALAAAVGAVWLAATLLLIRELGPSGLLLSAGAVTVLAAGLVHPLVPFCLYFGALFFADTRLPGLPLSANQVLALLFFASWAVYWARGKTVRLESRIIPFLIVFALFFAISAITGESTERGLLHFRYVVIYFFMALALASTLSSERAVLAFAWIVVIMTFLAAMVGVYEAIEKNALQAYTGGRWTDAARIKGTAKNAIVYGWNLLYCFPFAFLLFSELRTRSRRYLALALGVAVLGVAILTFNRQTFALIGLMVVLCTLLFRYRDRRALLAIVGVAAVIAAIVAAPLVIQRLMTFGSLRRDSSFIERRDQFIVGMEMFRTKPIWGIGLGSYPARWRAYVPRNYSTFNMQYQGAFDRYPDAGFVQLLSETGIVGTALTLTLMGWIIRRAWRTRRMADGLDDRFAFNLASMVLALGVFWVASNIIQDTFLYVRVWLLIGLAVLLDERILLPQGCAQPPPADGADA
ncbi:MAG: O-antigen ligase family protein [Candidatus Sumerlaeaceae bacterium]|nr:O-antigen ligase family protein [Candidatus Sumerlaeaceae bacterium]